MLNVGRPAVPGGPPAAAPPSSRPEILLPGRGGTESLDEGVPLLSEAGSRRVVPSASF